MRLPRFQFTIRRLVAVVALCALCFALLRSPVGLLLAYFMLFLPGFLISRAHGGWGILGGGLSESAFSAPLSIGWNLWHTVPRYPSLIQAITELSSDAVWAAAAGFIVGLVVSLVLSLIIELTKALSHAFHV